MMRFSRMVDSPFRRALVLLTLAVLAPACDNGGGGGGVIIIPPFSITTGGLPNGVVGTVYPPQTISTVSGTAPITFALFSGTLPAGLNLAPATGIISGTPTGPGPGFSSFTIRATDANGLVANRVLAI